MYCDCNLNTQFIHQRHRKISSLIREKILQISMYRFSYFRMHLQNFRGFTVPHNIYLSEHIANFKLKVGFFFLLARIRPGRQQSEGTFLQLSWASEQESKVKKKALSPKAAFQKKNPTTLIFIVCFTIISIRPFARYKSKLRQAFSQQRFII